MVECSVYNGDVDAFVGFNPGKYYQRLTDVSTAESLCIRNAPSIKVNVFHQQNQNLQRDVSRGGCMY